MPKRCRACAEGHLPNDTSLCSHPASPWPDHGPCVPCQETGAVFSAAKTPMKNTVRHPQRGRHMSAKRRQFQTPDGHDGADGTKNREHGNLVQSNSSVTRRRLQFVEEMSQLNEQRPVWVHVQRIWTPIQQNHVTRHPPHNKQWEEKRGEGGGKGKGKGKGNGRGNREKGKKSEKERESEVR